MLAFLGISELFPAGFVYLSQGRRRWYENDDDHCRNHIAIRIGDERAKTVSEPQHGPRPQESTENIERNNLLYCILPTPATIGANVRTIGMNLAKTIVLAPYFS